MTTVAEITAAVRRLSRRELARFRAWFINYDAAEWDRQLEADVAAGRLDTLIRNAQRDYRGGRCRALRLLRSTCRSLS